MSATYYPIVSHGGIPIMTNANGGITTKHLLQDTRVGKKVAPVLPHLIANTVDALARGTIGWYGASAGKGHQGKNAEEGGGEEGEKSCEYLQALNERI